MSSKENIDTPFWQFPYVNIFKQFKVGDWKKNSKEGDVSFVMDKQLKCSVYKLLGSVPAVNYIQLPQTNSQSLGLTGRYFYILFKPIPTKYFVVHLDTVCDGNLVVRISFSNLIKEFKTTSTWLQFPFLCQAAKGSVQHAAMRGVKSEQIGAAPLSQNWTMLVLDLKYILSVYMNRNFSHTKCIKLCANMLVKNCFTSDVSYDPTLSIRRARLIGIKSVDENLAPMPRELNFFQHKDKTWEDCYDLVRFPINSDNTVITGNTGKKLHGSPGRKVMAKPGTINGSPQFVKPKIISSKAEAIKFTGTRNKVRRKKKLVRELPEVGLSGEPADSCDPDPAVFESNAVHVFAGEDQETVVHRHFTESSPRVNSTSLRTRNVHDDNLKSRMSKHRSHDHEVGEADPVLELRKVIGFGGGFAADSFMAYRHLACWHPTFSTPENHRIIVYAVHAIIVAMETGSMSQHFFVGHTDRVTAIAFNRPINNSPCIMASSQCGVGGIVRIWRFESQKCSAIVRSQHSTTMNCLAFSQTGGVLVGVGRDRQGKTLVMVWDTMAALKHGTVSVIAKAHTDVEISRVRMCQTDDTRLATCGRDNVRFWRVRSNQLRSCPVAVPTEYKTEEVTDMCFAPLGIVSSTSKEPSNQSASVYCSTKGGYIFEVDFQTVAVRSVHKLYPASSCSENPSMDCSKKGIQLNSVKISDTFIATGSDDGFLRLWPLDLSTVFLEAQHEGPIADLDVTSDGGRVLVSTTVGTLGYLDVSTKKYSTVVRSHTDIIRDSSLDGLRQTLTTCSDDGSVRIWDLETLQQTYDFSIPDDQPTVVACHPLLEIFACGFESGSIQAFHVPTSSILSEHSRLHSGGLACVIFTPSGERMISLCENGMMVIFDTSDIEHIGAQILRKLPRCAAIHYKHGPQAIAVSIDGRRIAFVGPDQFSVTVASASTLDTVVTINLAHGLQAEPDILQQKPKLDFPTCVAFSPSNHLVVVTNGNNLVHLDIHSGKVVAMTKHINRKRTDSICVHRSYDSVVTSGDNLVKVWDASEDFSYQAFIGHISPVHNMTFTPDNLTLVTSAERSVFFWEFRGGARVEDKLKSVLEQSNGRKGGLEVEDSTTSSDDNENIEAFPDIEDKATTSHIGDKSSHNEDKLEPPSPPAKQAGNHSTWVAPEILCASDLRPHEVAEFTVDGDLMRRLTSDEVDSLASNISRSLKVASRGGDRNVASRGGDRDVASRGGDRDVASRGGDRDVASRGGDRDVASRGGDRDVASRGGDRDVASRGGDRDVASRGADRDVASRGGDRDVASRGGDRSDDRAEVVPVKVAWTTRLKQPTREVTEVCPEPCQVECEKPRVLSHFSHLPCSTTAASKLYKPKLGEEFLELQGVIGYNGNARRNIAWSPDNGALAYSSGCLVVLENLRTSEKKFLRGNTEEVSCLAMQNDGQIIAAASCYNGLNQSCISLFEVGSGHCRSKLTHHGSNIVALAYSRDDRFLASVGDFHENLVALWSQFDGVLAPVVLATATTELPIHQLSWNPNCANEFVTVGSNASLNFWLVEENPGNNETTLNVHNAEVPSGLKFDKTGREVAFTSACYGDNGTVYVASDNGVVSAWQTATNTCFVHWQADSAEIVCLQSRGQRLITAGVSQAVKMWSLAGLNQVKSSVDLKDGSLVLDDELSLNGEIIASVFDRGLDMGIVGTTNGVVWFVDWSERSTIRLVNGGKSKINAISFDGRGEFFSTCNDEGCVRLWCADTLELSVQFQVLGQSCLCTAFSKPCQEREDQRRMLAAGYSDGTVRIFDLNELVLKLKLKPHSTRVTCLEFSSSNEILLSAATDGAVVVTSVVTGVTLRKLKDHLGAAVSNLSISGRNDHPISSDQSGDVLMISGADRRVSLWLCDWSKDQCEVFDWLTFPAPCFAPDGSQTTNQTFPPSLCCFHPTDPDLLIYCGYGMHKALQKYSISQKKVVGYLTLPNWATCLAVSPSGNHFAIGTESHLLEVVDLTHGSFQDYVGHFGPLSNAQFSPDGKLLLSAANNEVLVWKTRHFAADC